MTIIVKLHRPSCCCTSRVEVHNLHPLLCSLRILSITSQSNNHGTTELDTYRLCSHRQVHTTHTQLLVKWAGGVWTSNIWRGLEGMHVDNRASESSSTGQEKASCNCSFPEIENVLVVNIILLWHQQSGAVNCIDNCALSITTTLYNLHFK